jgi:hypothetical protein
VPLDSYPRHKRPKATAVGLIDWSIQTSTDTFTGTVEGPVASTPEPTTLMPLALEMASLAVFRRKWYFPVYRCTG